MNYKIRLDGKHHSLLRCFTEEYDRLCCIEEGVRVGLGRFFLKNREKKGLFLQWYNPTTRTAKIKMNSRNKQYFFVRFKENKNLEKIQELLSI